MTQLSPLDYRPYPMTAGAKTGTTSREAADRIEATGRAEVLRRKCLAALRDGGMTAKELASYLQVDINSVRPRLSELKARNLIRESGLRRERQHVWSLTANH